MVKLTRRRLLGLAVGLPLMRPAWLLAFTKRGGEDRGRFPITLEVLKAAFKPEMSANQHYIGYTKKALEEGYPNIAYLFHSFSYSEKIHADNYKAILSSLFRIAIESPRLDIDVRDRKSNLRTAARKELDKIESVYPNFLRELEKESCDEAIVSCMYSWKSHKQHQEEVSKILEYSGVFFGKMAKKIEAWSVDFHVCRVCGSTIEVAPAAPCVICNRSMSNYMRIERPA